MPELHHINGVLARLAVPATALLGHPVAAVLVALLLASMTIASLLWKLYSEALVGDLVRPIVVWLRIKFTSRQSRIPPPPGIYRRGDGERCLVGRLAWPLGALLLAAGLDRRCSAASLSNRLMMLLEPSENSDGQRDLSACRPLLG